MRVRSKDDSDTICTNSENLDCNTKFFGILQRFRLGKSAYAIFIVILFCFVPILICLHN